MRTALLLLLLAGAGCGTRSPATATIPPPANLAAPTIVGSVPAPVGSASPKIFDDIEDDTDRFADRYVGFSKDDAYLGYSISTCDPCPLEFHFESPTRSPLDLAYYSDPGNWDEAKEKATDAAVDKQLAALGVEKIDAKPRLRGPFPFPDLAFARFVDPAPAIGKSSLLFGARVNGYAPVYPIRITLGPHPMFDSPVPAGEDPKEWREQWGVSDPTLAYANVTHDGSEIGVVAMSSGTMWWETAGIARMPVASFVGQVYNDTGMRLHEQKKYAEAGALFAKAEGANPKESLFPYNLACALARSGDPAKAKEALARAIDRGGPKIKERAAKDADLAGLQ